MNKYGKLLGTLGVSYMRTPPSHMNDEFHHEFN